MSLEQILLNRINDVEGWISKGQLYLTAEEAGYSPETAGRYLRTMAKKDIIQVSYYSGKKGQKLARYARIGTETPKPPIKTYEEVLENGIPIMRIINNIK